MMDLMRSASDDQVALMGCLVALIGSASLMYVSFFIGPAARRSHGRVDAKIVGEPTAASNVIALPAEPSRERAA